MEPRKTILVIEDEPHIVLGLNDALEFEGFRVFTAQAGKEGVQLARHEKPDAVLLDLMLPDINGYQVCEDLRRHDPFVPIIMLTARARRPTRSAASTSGADDYVTKPFSVGELIARIRAIFRRASRARRDGTEASTIGDVDGQRDRAHRAARGKQAPRRSRSTRSSSCACCTSGWASRSSREEILNKIWGVEASPTNRTVDNFIVKLRQEDREAPDKPEHILTVYGFGYKLVP